MEELIGHYRSKGLLLDANLLLLLVVGNRSPGLIGKGKLKHYLHSDFLILKRFTILFPEQVTTAHILTEVSNLLGDFPDGPQRRTCFLTYAATINVLREEQVASRSAASRSEFVFLGLTDCVIAELASSFLVLSADARMMVKLHEAGLNAINFNHFRVDLQRLSNNAGRLP